MSCSAIRAPAQAFSPFAQATSVLDVEMDTTVLQPFSSPGALAWGTTAPEFVTNATGYFQSTGLGIETLVPMWAHISAFFSVPAVGVIRGGTRMILTIDGVQAPQVPDGTFDYARRASGDEEMSNTIPRASVLVGANQVISFSTVRVSGGGGVPSILVPAGQALLHVEAAPI